MRSGLPDTALTLLLAVGVNPVVADGAQRDEVCRYVRAPFDVRLVVVKFQMSGPREQRSGVNGRRAFRTQLAHPAVADRPGDGGSQQRRHRVPDLTGDLDLRPQEEEVVRE